MMKINEYVRTKKYGIAKIISNPNEGKFNVDLFKKDGVTLRCLKEKDIIGEPSSDIIDLLEVEDLAKIEFYSPRYEKRVTRLFEVEYKRGNIIDFRNAHCNLSIYYGNWANEDKELKPIIKEIITREQIEQVSYKVGEVDVKD